MTGADMGRHGRTITHFWENVYIPSGLNGSSMFSQYTKHHMTTVDRSGQHRSRAPALFFEGIAVLVVDPNHAAEPVGHQITGLDPSPDLAFVGLVALCDLLDGREFGFLICLYRCHHLSLGRGDTNLAGQGYASTVDSE